MSGGSACSVALMHGGGSTLRPEAEHGGAYSFVVRYVVVWYLRGVV